jgi:hypothetical protein
VLTGISFPVKILLRVAVAFQIQPQLFSSGAMREWDVVIRNIIKEVNLLFFEKEASRDGVNWGVTPSLVEEAAILI